jgi:hypothetical protein
MHPSLRSEPVGRIMTSPSGLASICSRVIRHSVVAPAMATMIVAWQVEGEQEALEVVLVVTLERDVWLGRRRTILAWHRHRDAGSLRARRRRTPTSRRKAWPRAALSCSATRTSDIICHSSASVMGALASTGEYAASGRGAN